MGLVTTVGVGTGTSLLRQHLPRLALIGLVGGQEITMGKTVRQPLL